MYARGPHRTSAEAQRRPRPRRRGRGGRSAGRAEGGGGGGFATASASSRPVSPSWSNDVPTTRASRSGASEAPSTRSVRSGQNPSRTSGAVPFRPPVRPSTFTVHSTPPSASFVSSTGIDSAGPTSSSARAGVGGLPRSSARGCGRRPSPRPPVPRGARAPERAAGGGAGGRAGGGRSESFSDMGRGCRGRGNSPYYLRLARPR